MPSFRLSKKGIFFLCLLITVALRFRVDPLRPGGPHWDFPGDAHKYIYVAEHPLGSFHIQPMCWRIGVPLATRLLPFSTYRNFDILSVLFLALSGGMLYLWLLEIPLSPQKSLIGVLMFYSLGGASKMLLGGITTPDPASYFFLLLALYAIYKEKDLLFVVALVLGVLVKETVILAGPLYYSLKADSWWDARRLKRFVLVFAPGVIVLITVRLLIPAWNDREAYVQSLPFIYTQVSSGMVKYDLLTAFRGTMWTYQQFSPVNLVRMFTYGSLGLFLFFPFFAPRANREPFIRWLPYFLPVIGSMFIAVNPDRRVSSLFPILIILGLNGIAVLARVLSLNTNDFLVLFSMTLALVLFKKDVTVVPFDLEAAVFLGWLVYVVVRKSRTAPPSPLPDGEGPSAVATRLSAKI
jgi:hypothetical protein